MRELTDFATEYVSLYELIKEHMQWDTPKALQWMHEANPHFGEYSPIAMIAMGRGHKVRSFVEVARGDR